METLARILLGSVLIVGGAFRFVIVAQRGLCPQFDLRAGVDMRAKPPEGLTPVANDETGGMTYELSVPFWIDTDPYSESERSFFAYGFEYATVAHLLRFYDGPFGIPIHRENESRVRMLVGHVGRRCEITPLDGPEWSRLEVERC